MYLACNFGMKVANIPIVRDVTIANNLLARLSSLKQEIIFGLTMQPEVLAHVREERSTLLAQTAESRRRLQVYHNLYEIREEIRFCRNMYASKSWQVIDVTRRAIEEISLEILGKLGHEEH